MAGKMGKGRQRDDPYMTLRSADDTWEWRLLKSWQANDGKPYARWFCSVSSPHTQGGTDLGDTYVYDVLVTGRAHVVSWDRTVFTDGDEVERLVEAARAAQRANGDPMAFLSP